VPSCFLWCLWGEHNDRSPEDRERSLAEFKSLFLILFIFGQAMFLAPFVLSFHDLGVFFVYFLYTWAVPLTFNDFLITYKKKNHILTPP